MIKKQQQFLIKGMNQDIAETKVQPELAHSIKNLRVITDEDSGTLSLVTEKGTLEKDLNISIETKLEFLINYNQQFDSIENFFSGIDNSIVLQSSPAMVLFYYDYAIEWYTIKVFANSTNSWSIIRNLNRNYFAQYVDISGTLINTTLSSGNWKYTVTREGSSVPNIRISIYDSSDNYIDSLLIEPDAEKWNWIVDNENKSITFGIPVIDFRYAVNNYLDRSNPFGNNTALVVNSKITNSIDSIRENAQSEDYVFTLKNVLGKSVIDKDIYLFGISNNFELGDYDCIVKIKNFTNNPIVSFLYLGNLNFDIAHPIKTYVSYESEEQKRIYWIDGKNQPRVINVSKTYEFYDNNSDNHFELCSQLPTSQNVKITKNNFGGVFHSGIIQYFFTYVDKNEQESKIFYQSPLYYITQNERSASPEEMCSCSFNILISSIDNSNWLRKQIRCYSILRTSLNSEVVAKVVSVINLKDNDNKINFVDNGQIGYSIDSQVLFALGCEEFVPQTFAVKNNTMFFGNVQIKDVTSRDNFPELSNLLIVGIKTDKNIKERIANSRKEFQLSESKINGGNDQGVKGFMFQEDYMLGLQFLHKNGSWSEPVWICDKKMTKAPSISSDETYHTLPYFYTNISSLIAKNLMDDGYIQVRPLVVCNDYANARVLCNGILNPTIHYVDNNIYMSSWFFRPFTISDIIDNNTAKSLGFRFIKSSDNDFVSNEVQGEEGGNSGNRIKVSQKYITFNSPEIEFEKINSIESGKYKVLYSGFYEITGNKFDSDIKTSTLPLHKDGGFKRNNGQYNYTYNPNTGVEQQDREENAGMTFLGGNCWYDKFVDEVSPQNGKGYIQIYPWENNTSYIGYSKTEDIIYSAPESKTITNWRLNQYCQYIDNNNITDSFYDVLSDIKIIHDSSNIIKTDENINDNTIYYKDTDILFLPNELTIYSTGTLDHKTCEEAYPVRIQYRSTPHILLQPSREKLPKFWKSVSTNPYNSSGYEGINFNKTSPERYCCLLQGTLINKDYDNNVTIHFGGRDSNGKPTENSLNNSKWLIAGEAKKLNTSSIIVEWKSGDTYYQRYNCLKTYPYSHESKDKVIEIASVMIQTRVNIDGTYDAQKDDILHIEPTNFNLLNDVYSQEDNFFTFRNITTKMYNDFKNTIFWTPQKNFGLEIDSWCNVRLANSIDISGNNGEITAIVNWNDNLLIFQDKAIHKLNYNENTILNGQNGLPVILQGSDRVTGATLISGQFGCQNEWSIVNAKSGLYFSDDYNHKLYVLSDGIKCISDELGFKSYLKNKNYSGVWTPNRNAGTTLHTYYNQQLGDIYFTDGSSCLTYNESLNLFTSFYDYTDVYVKIANLTGNPKTSGYYEYINDSYTLTNDTSVNSSKVYYSYSNKKLFDFVNIENKNYWILNDFTNNTPLFYEHRAIDNLYIFGNNKDYEIELTANIDPHVDKIFDTIEIRGDAYINNSLQSGYNIDDNVIDYNKNITSLPFDTIKVSNEYQDTGTKELQFTKDIKTTASKNSMKQKFRIWRAQIGRDATNVRDRIRNYWSRIKLTKNGTSNLKAKVHDIVVDVYE